MTESAIRTDHGVVGGSGEVDGDCDSLFEIEGMNVEDCGDISFVGVVC